MKKNISVNYTIDANIKATGFAAIACTVKNALDKIKSFFTGDKGDDSAIAGCAAINVEINSSIEYSVEEARTAADILQEQYDNLSKNMGQIVDASKQFGEYLRDESKNWIVTYKELNKTVEPTAEEKAAAKEKAAEDIRRRIRDDLANGYDFQTKKYSAAEKRIAKEIWKELFDEEMPKEKAEELFPSKKKATPSSDEDEKVE